MMGWASLLVNQFFIYKIPTLEIIAFQCTNIISCESLNKLASVPSVTT